MDQRQTVDEDSDVITVIVGSTLAGGYSVLIDNLQNIVVNILFVNEGDILAFAVIALQHLHMVFLDQPGLFRDVRIGIGQHFLEEPIPLPVSELISIHLGKLRPEVGDKVCFLVDLQITITQILEHPDKLLLQLSLTLVTLGSLAFGGIFSYNCTFAALRNDIKICHNDTSSMSPLVVIVSFQGLISLSAPIILTIIGNILFSYCSFAYINTDIPFIGQSNTQNFNGFHATISRKAQPHFTLNLGRCILEVHP